MAMRAMIQNWMFDLDQADQHLYDGKLDALLAVASPQQGAGFSR